MFTANGFYSQLHGSYLFYEVGKRAQAFAKAHPEAKIIRMGIGDVTRPLVPAVVEAMHKAVDDMSKAESGKVEMHPEPYTAEDFMGYLDAIIRPLCEEKNLKLVIEANPIPNTAIR